MLTDERRFVSASGVTLQLKSVNQNALSLLGPVVEREFRAKGEPVDPPTYTIKTVAGDVEKYAHDLTTLEDPKDPEETLRNQHKWAAYQNALTRMRAETTKRQNTAALVLGTDFPMPEDESWIEQFEWMGVAVPEHPRDRRAFYLVNVLLTQAEQYELIARLQLLSQGDMISESDKAAYLENFRRQMAGFVRSSVDQAFSASRQLVGQAATGGDDLGQGAPPAAEPVGQPES